MGGLVGEGPGARVVGLMSKLSEHWATHLNPDPRRLLPFDWNCTETSVVDLKYRLLCMAIAIK